MNERPQSGAEPGPEPGAGPELGPLLPPPPPPPTYQFPYAAAQPPRKKNRAAKIGGIGCLGLVVLFAIAGIASIVSGGKNASSIAAPLASSGQTGDTTGAGGAGDSGGAAASAPVEPSATDAAAVPASSPSSAPAASKHVVLTVHGNGIKTTKTFSTGDDWSITYSFDCSSFGSQGNFQVYVYSDGSLSDAPVNELSEKGGDTTYEHDASGTHYLDINSECSWTVTVTDGDTGQ
ncbi:MAG TPA: hypothetical protein VFU74_09340 [Actinocrinis sp.]|nr:hypothetical protein [Actinocrinis sp.]